MPIPPTAESRDHLDWAYIRSIVLEHRGTLLGSNLIAILAAAVAVPVPLLIPLLVDEVLLNQPGVLVETCQRFFPADWQGATFYIAATLALTILLRAATAVLNVWHTRRFTLISKDVVFRLRRHVIGRLKRISMAEYESLGGGAVVSHLVTDMDTLDSFLGNSIARMVVAILSLIGTAVVLFWMNWQLALVILLLNPVVMVVTRAMGKWVKRLKRNENDAVAAFQAALAETLEGIHQIRASNREQHYFDSLSASAGRLRDAAGAYAWKSDAASRLSSLVFLSGFDLFRTVSVFMVLVSDLSLGEMMAVSGYLWFMMAPVQEILGLQYGYFGAKAALERIGQLYDRRQEPKYPHVRNPFKDRVTVGIRVKDLAFEYQPGSPVLQGIDLDIRPGEKVALIGASGGGKSTLVQVLIGLYPPSGGMVYFDGVALDQIGMDVVRENVVTVLQHPVLFNDTVRANLTLGRLASDADLWRALSVARMKETVEQFPDGLDTRVGRLGLRLSGGQRQRLAIARMVLAEPKVVILDEATSAVDNLTEAELYRELDRFLAQRTTLIVAHRLSAIRHADRIVVFEDGRVVENGSHEDLIGQNGLYARLHGA